MYLLSGKKEECTGCGACAASCPVGAIRREEGEDTFFYPVIDAEKCIHCHSCERICPTGHSDDARLPLHCEAGITRNAEDELKSSSGGAFKCVVEACIRHNREQYHTFYICGCEWTEHFQVRHTITRYTGPESISRYSKAKYVQSDTWGIFPRIKELLAEKSNYLVFCGTPCQVAALKRYLKREYTNLLSIDIICHGAPSQHTFDNYITEWEAREGAKLLSYEFRNKRILPNGTKYSRSSRLLFANGREHLVTRFTDDYVNIFYTKSYHYRPSCYPCGFKRPERHSDITLGDAWHLEKLYPELNPMHGISVMCYHTPAAMRLRDTVAEQMTIYPCDYEFIVAHNKPLRETEINPCPGSILDAFFADQRSAETPFSESVARYIKAIETYLS